MISLAQTYTEEQVQFASGPNWLEGVLAYPDAGTAEEAVLLLSPHPHLGGRMDNNVIAFLAQGLAAAGRVTLRFNYGGVGGSTLALADGDSAYEYWARIEAGQNYRAALPDALTARKFLCAAIPDARVGYVGYSFGACLAVLLAGVHPPDWLVAISPPVSRAPLDGVENLTMSSLFIAGDRDFAFDREGFDGIFARVPGPKKFVEIPGSDHFFRRDEARVFEALSSWRSDEGGVR